MLGFLHKVAIAIIVVWTVYVKTVDGGSFCHRHSLACVSKHKSYGDEKRSDLANHVFVITMVYSVCYFDYSWSGIFIAKF